VRQTTLATLDSTSLTAAFNTVYTDYVVPLSMTEPQLAQHVANNDIDLEHSPLWLAEDGRVVGLAALGVRGARGWIGGFGVAPQWRGQGLSHQFTAATLTVARELGLRTVQLEVITTNPRAIRAQSVTIGELVAGDAADAHTLLGALAYDYPGRTVSLLNEPADDPTNGVFDALGFNEILRQHEMLATL
jgi:GNAT superfamily N-acetyltransferase